MTAESSVSQCGSDEITVTVHSALWVGGEAWPDDEEAGLRKI